MPHRLTALLLGCFLPVYAYAQPVLTACVVDEADAAPLEGAYVQFEGLHTQGLFQTDASGCVASTASPVAAEALPASLPSALALGAPFPNPTAGPTAVPLTLPRPATATFTVYDLRGRRVQTGMQSMPAGEASFQLDLSWQAAGVYFVRVEAGGAFGTAVLTRGPGAASSPRPAARALQPAAPRVQPDPPRLRHAAFDTGMVYVSVPFDQGVFFNLAAAYGARSDTTLVLTPLTAPDTLYGSDVPGAPDDGDEGDEPDVFVIVEDMPILAGGLESLQRRLRYPELARAAGIEGRVIVQFTVLPTGHVSDPVVVRSIGAGCDEEALRLVRTAIFLPGRQRGVPVRVRFSLPITFRLD